jgi:23S rRNA pseudouridine1911/1915/1917 synthase
MDLVVPYEDEHLLVVDKPAGLVVHPAPGQLGGTLLNALLARDAQAAGLPRAGIVHRLDKDTSGLMVVARSRRAMDALVAQIGARQVRREYLALAHRPGRARPSARWMPHRARPAQPPAHGGGGLAAPPGKPAQTLVQRLRTPKPAACCAACCAPAARTRSACTWRSWAIRWWATRCTAARRRPAWRARPCARRLSLAHPVTGAALDCGATAARPDGSAGGLALQSPPTTRPPVEPALGPRGTPAQHLPSPGTSARTTRPGAPCPRDPSRDLRGRQAHP